MKLSVNGVAVLSYLLALSVLSLASSYLGGVFRYLSAVALALPVLSLLHLLVVSAGIRIDQRFDEAQPARGEEIGFSAFIDNTSFLPAPRLTTALTLSYPGSDIPSEEISLSLGARDGYAYRTPVVCAHRGDYTVGLSWYRLTDLLGWLTVRRDLPRRTFTVYPRINTIHFAARPGQEGAGAGRTHRFGREVDPTLLRGLAEYQRNEPIKHIAWRKFAAHGIPYLKEYDSGQRPATVVYLDMRAVGSPRRLDAEDCSVEVLVALVKSLVEAEIPVEVHGVGATRFEARVTTRSQFHEFYLSTRRIVFGGDIAPSAVIAAHGVRRTDRPEASLVVTHRVDHSVMALFRGGGRAKASGIINTAALSDSERAHARQLAHQITMEGGSLHLVGEGVDLAQELTA